MEGCDQPGLAGVTVLSHCSLWPVCPLDPAPRGRGAWGGAQAWQPRGRAGGRGWWRVPAGCLAVRAWRSSVFSGPEQRRLVPLSPLVLS